VPEANIIENKNTTIRNPINDVTINSAVIVIPKDTTMIIANTKKTNEYTIADMIKNCFRGI
jgi:hypothetical protein